MGGTSWVAGDWSTGAGEDLKMSREENTEGEQGKEKQRNYSKSNKRTRYKTESLGTNTAGIITRKAKNVSAWIAGSGGLL